MSAAELRAAVLDFAGCVARCPGAHTLIACPCCGDQNINDLSAELEPGFATCSRGGIVLELLCGRGHRWQLRLSNWFMPPEYSAAAMKEKFQQEMARPDSPNVAHIRAKMRRGKKLPDKIKWKGETLDFGGL